MILPTDPDDLPPPSDEDIEITPEEMAAMREDAENEGAYEQPPGPLKFHYGDGQIIDAGTMIHDDCGGIISIIDNGTVCEKCGANADLPPIADKDPITLTMKDGRTVELGDFHEARVLDVTPEQLASDPLYKTIDGRDLPPEIIGQPLFDKLQGYRAASESEIAASEVAAWDTVVEESVLAPTCTERHVSNCECRGAARGPRP